MSLRVILGKLTYTYFVFCIESMLKTATSVLTIGLHGFGLIFFITEGTYWI